MKTLVLFAFLMSVMGAGCQFVRPEIAAPSSTLVRTERAGNTVISGVLASELSQTSGIKMWRVDENHRVVTTTNSWVWVIPEEGDYPDLREGWTGRWVAYMLERYAGISRADQDELDFGNVMITVTGKQLGSDCDVADNKVNDLCITTIETKSIAVEKLN